LVFKDGNSYTYETSGIFQNALGSQIYSSCGYVDDGDADSYELDDVLLTASFCADGTQIALGDVTDDEYFQACPQDWLNL
jgi:hypothetical protein